MPRENFFNLATRLVNHLSLQNREIESTTQQNQNINDNSNTTQNEFRGQRANNLDITDVNGTELQSFTETCNITHHEQPPPYTLYDSCSVRHSEIYSSIQNEPHFINFTVPRGQQLSYNSSHSSSFQSRSFLDSNTRENQSSILSELNNRTHAPPSYAYSILNPALLQISGTSNFFQHENFPMLTSETSFQLLYDPPPSYDGINLNQIETQLNTISDRQSQNSSENLIVDSLIFILLFSILYVFLFSLLYLFYIKLMSLYVCITIYCSFVVICSVIAILYCIIARKNTKYIISVFLTGVVTISTLLFTILFYIYYKNLLITV